MISFSQFAFSVLPLLVSAVDAAYIWPNRLVEELDHILIDTSGYNNGHFADGVTPCRLYYQGPQTSGRQTAGQWMRVAFHDFATHDLVKGTGGLDASIGFETTREENSGVAMNDSLSYWRNYVNNHVSMADMIAMGTTVAMISCEGPQIPLKGGRVDATEGGEFGVPEPSTDIQTTLAQFKKAGMSPTEGIQLTACGHTVGHVHNNGFPTVVNTSAISPNNTGGGIAFDDTFDTFDNHVATGYLDGTTTNPLVTSFNVSSRSDLRLFVSDNNKTMKDLARSNDHFQDVCVQVMTKQLNSVPRGVSLQDVQPIPVKPINVQVSINDNGDVTLTGAIRLLGTSFKPNSARTVTINTVNRNGIPGSSFAATQTTTDTQGSSVYLGGATTYFYPFSTTIPVNTGIRGFTVTVKESSKDRGTTYNNYGKTFTVQDKVVWVPSKSTASVDSSQNLATVNIAAAVLQSQHMTNVHGVFYVPEPVIGTMNPSVTSHSQSFTKTSSVGQYDIYTGSFSVTTLNATNYHTTFDVAAQSYGINVADDFRKFSSLQW